MLKVLVNSVPKSGTNLLLQMVKAIPGLRNEQSVSYDGDRFREVLQIRSSQVVSGHIPYDAAFSLELQSHSIKHVFIYRDLRDVAVSLVHFINDKLHQHPLYPVFQYRLKTFEEQLSAVITGITYVGDERGNSSGLDRYPGIYEEFRRIYEWRHDDAVCSMRYEDLVSGEESKIGTIHRLIDYLWEDSASLPLEKSGLIRRIVTNMEPKHAWTFRKGGSGGWRQAFSEANKTRFKAVTGDFLIRLGYEQTNDW